MMPIHETGDTVSQVNSSVVFS